jgi:hypothetical protein
MVCEVGTKIWEGHATLIIRIDRENGWRVFFGKFIRNTLVIQLQGHSLNSCVKQCHYNYV